MRFFLALLALVLPLSAQETMVRHVYDTATDTHVEVLALFSRPSPGGYFPVRVKVANNLKRAGEVRLAFTSGHGYGDNLDAASSFTISADAEKTVVRDILVPIRPTSRHQTSYPVELRLSGTFGDARGYISGDYAPDQPAVLLSEALFTPNASSLDAEISRSGGRHGSTTFASKFDPKQLPDDWRAFSGFDSILMTGTDWLDIPPGGQSAILSWVRLGGQLLIHSTGGPTLESLGQPENTSYGEILDPVIGSGLSLDAAQTVAVVSKHVVPPRQLSVHHDFRNKWPLQQLFGEKKFQYELFVIVLILFGILVGPVNLFVFAKSGQRHRLFITTPLISLGASLLLIGIIIVQDGFGGSGMRRVLMEVRPDGDLNAAYLHQEQFSRTGVLMSSRFTIDTPATFEPVPIRESRWARYTGDYDSAGSFDLQPADGKLLANGDWFQSRSEHGHVLSAVVPTRGRIETTDAPGTFLSTFDYPIEALYFLDDARQWHVGKNITSGKRFTLTPVAPDIVNPILVGEIKKFSTRNNGLLRRAKERRGHFVAITTHAPGIDTHPGIRWKETRTVITGPVVSP